MIKSLKLFELVILNKLGVVNVSRNAMLRHVRPRVQSSLRFAIYSIPVSEYLSFCSFFFNPVSQPDFSHSEARSNLIILSCLVIFCRLARVFRLDSSLFAVRSFYFHSQIFSEFNKQFVLTAICSRGGICKHRASLSNDLQLDFLTSYNIN